MVRKAVGQDIELGNLVTGRGPDVATGPEASRALLAEMDGCSCARPAREFACPCGCGQESLAAAVLDLRDLGRKWRVNGSCCYIDSGHLELASAETTSAFDQVACTHAELRSAQVALARANARRDPRHAIKAMVNNSDGRGNWYGSHVNVLLSRTLWDRIFRGPTDTLSYLASFQASAAVVFGQGKVGSENGAPHTPFQLSQRADFFMTLVGPDTMAERRSFVNSRREPLCGTFTGEAAAGRPGTLARLHVICYDSSLCDVSMLLKLGTAQIQLGMMEAGVMAGQLRLADPMRAVRTWSHDPTLRALAELQDGRRFTVVEHQLAFFDEAQRFVDAGRCADVVPRAPEIIAIWGRVLAALHAGRVEDVEGQLDWALKLSVLRKALGRPGMTWESPQIKYLDFAYSSLDPGEGLFWAHLADGLVERVVSDEEISHFMTSPPADTRAWTRGMLLRHAEAARIAGIDWDVVRVASPDGRGAPRTVHLPDPCGATRADTAWAFENAADIDEVLRRLATEETPSPVRLFGHHHSQATLAGSRCLH